MKNKILGELLKILAIVALAVLIRFDVNPILYLFLGILFYLGWKVQHAPDFVVVPRPAKHATGVIARRVSRR